MMTFAELLTLLGADQRIAIHPNFQFDTELAHLTVTSYGFITSFLPEDRGRVFVLCGGRAFYQIVVGHPTDKWYRRVFYLTMTRQNVVTLVEAV